MKDKNNELIVIKANRMIQDYKYTLSKTEMRVVNAIISNIKSPKYDTELNMMEFDIKDFCKLLGFNESEAGGNQYKILRNTLRGLSNKSSDYIDFGDYETIVRWIDKPIFEKGTGIVKLKLDDDLKPFLLQASGTMQSKLKYYFKMDSKYSMRLYELLKSWDGVKRKEFSVEELRLSIDAIQSSYSQFGKFRQGILDPAVKEINEHTDLLISYDTRTRGRKVLAIVFDIAHQIEKEVVSVVEPEVEEEYQGEEISVELNEEISEEEKLEKQKISLFREFLRNHGQEFSDDHIREQREAALASAYAKTIAQDPCIDPDMIDISLEHYIRAQELYVRARSSHPKGLHGYMVKALREDHAGFYQPPEEDEADDQKRKNSSKEQEHSFDTDEFFEAALKHSMGNAYDPSFLKK